MALPNFPRVFVHGAADPGAAWWDALRAAIPGAPRELAARDASAALALAARDPADTLLLAAGAALPPFFAERIARAVASTGAAVVSALGNAHAALSPLREGARDAAPDWLAWDGGVYLAGARGTCESEHWSPTCSLWRAAALAYPPRGPRLPETLAGALATDLFVADPSLPLAGPPVPADPRDRITDAALGALRERAAAFAGAAYPGADPRPVALHVVHGWGGGAERFVRDLAAADPARIHLALVSRGHSTSQAYGEWLELALAADPARALRRWPLPRPIGATALSNDGYRAAFETTVRDYAVDQLVVSSLIGHSLDALALGVPVTVVAHDYFPFWPELHRDFGDASLRIDRDALETRLKSRELDTPFRERDAAWWSRVRESYVDALLRAHATIVAPSESVRANLARIEPRLAATVIPHGLAPFGDAYPAPLPPPPARERLRVLVLGRIAGGKAERLLREVAPALAGRVEFFLLGCGKAGESFFAHSHVHVVLDYDRAELPSLVARIAPDVALLAASVAETYSYTLSELRALGVPVLATAIGSFAERIAHGRDGLLAAPDARALVAALDALLADRAPLAAIREALANEEPRTLARMGDDYARVLPAAKHARVAPAGSALAFELADAAQRAAVAERGLEALRATSVEQQAELARRGEWAHDLDRKLAAARAAAAAANETIDAERAAHHDTGQTLAAFRARLSELQAEFDERTDWAIALDRRVHELEDERGRVYHSVSWRITRPLREFLDWFAARRTAASYRWQRLRTLVHRGRLSLSQRGVIGTLERLPYVLGRKPAPLPAPEIPAIDPQFPPIAVPASATPRVSVVIPVYNQYRHTYTCLRSIVDHPGDVPFEVIVVDDCSSDETPTALPQIGGIVAIRNPENLGFIGACNAGAARARGEFLVFLNNDTAIQPGWLEQLVGTFERFGDCGLAGAKLVYPDGRLQEAGGIVFGDASGWNYGRFGDPADCAYNYVREADYCSGAAIMIRRELFEKFGGFDVRYKPAYYEDTDLAFRVREEAGLKVYYQPASVVVHFEGVTSGTDTSTGTKKYQVVNQGKFLERWADALKRQPKPGTPIEIAREHRVRGRILIVDATTPQPDHDSGSLRLVNTMRALIAMGWKVSFFAENLAYVERYTRDLQQLGVEVLYHPWIPDPVAFFRSRGAEFDAVWISRHYVASALIPLVRRFAPRAKVLFDTVDLHYLREQRAAALEPDGSQLAQLAAKTKAQELRVVRAADVTLVVSPVEQQLLRLECPAARVEVLSNVHAVAGAMNGYEHRRDLFFVGGFQHPPNVGAVKWFVEDVWPRVASALPDAKFHIVGSNMPEEIARLMNDRVVAHGFVDDLTPFLHDCRISVAPLRYGAGVKGKVNQAMAHGMPVVATSVAVEGMHLAPGREVLVADEPAAFAAEVVRAYNDPALWAQLSGAGQENVRRHFSFEAATEALRKILS